MRRSYSDAGDRSLCSRVLFVVFGTLLVGFHIGRLFQARLDGVAVMQTPSIMAPAIIMLPMGVLLAGIGWRMIVELFTELPPSEDPR